MSEAAAGAGSLRLGLIGSPNCGKTTLFNALTGLRARVGNYPGVTVERREGLTHAKGRRIEVVDLRSTNGTYIQDQRLPPHKAVPWREGPSVRIGPFNITLEKPSDGAEKQD